MILDVISWIGSNIISSVTALVAVATLAITWKTLKLSKKHLLFGTTREPFLHVQRIVNSKKIEAAEIFWKSTLGIRHNFPSQLENMDPFFDVEYKKRTEILTDLRKSNDAMEACDQAVDGIRLHINSELWLIYLNYRSIIQAICRSFIEDIENSEKSRWYEDEKKRNAIENALSQEVLDEIDRQETSKIHWLQMRFEYKIISSLNEFISGEKFEKESLERAEELQNKIYQTRLHFRRF